MKRKPRNKVIVRDAFGTRWWVNIKTQDVRPTHWKLQAALDSLKDKEKK